ncbi:MAG: carbon-nitrogen hydrolase family protein [Thermoplasmatales archaeon]|nr:carbon-nitrogen hydrolase family protein [Thermoplasmatales archaeon]MCW6170066.1 carbon-nitrogen hydrolase family protein [Thermoplasmatales archaeon]
MKILSFQARISAYSELDSIVKKIERKLETSKADSLIMPEKWLNTVLEEKSAEYRRVMDMFTNISDSFSCLVIPGSFSVERSYGLFNSAPVFYKGELKGYQDKISLFGPEKSKYRSGNELKVFRAQNIAFGIAVCYDLDFPYYVKVQVRQGARIIFNPSLILKRYREMWHLYVKLRSLENRVPVVSVNSISDPLGGGSLATHMTQDDSAVLLNYTNAGRSVSMLSEIDLESHIPMIERRMLEDPGEYSTGHI